MTSSSASSTSATTARSGLKQKSLAGSGTFCLLTCLRREANFIMDVNVSASHLTCSSDFQHLMVSQTVLAKSKQCPPGSRDILQAKQRSRQTGEQENFPAPNAAP